jgi:hypothetical protein
MFLDRHVLRGSWWRYVVCRSYEAHGGRVLSGSEAVSVIVELRRNRDEQQVRALYADLTNSFNISRVSNDEVQRWFSYELGGSVLGAGGGRVFLVNAPGRGSWGPGEKRPLRAASEGARSRRAANADVSKPRWRGGRPGSRVARCSITKRFRSATSVLATSW